MLIVKWYLISSTCTLVNNITSITFCTLSGQYTVQTGIETYQHDNTPDAQYRATYWEFWTTNWTFNHLDRLQIPVTPSLNMALTFCHMIICKIHISNPMNIVYKKKTSQTVIANSFLKQQLRLLWQYTKVLDISWRLFVKQQKVIYHRDRYSLYLKDGGSIGWVINF